MKRTFKQGVTILDTEGAGSARSSASGHKGVYWEERTKRYYVRWSRISLGAYDDFDEAVAVREEAEAHAKAGTLDVWLKEHRRKKGK